MKTAYPPCRCRTRVRMDKIRLDRNLPRRQTSFNELPPRKFGQRKVAVHHPAPRPHDAVQTQHPATTHLPGGWTDSSRADPRQGTPFPDNTAPTRLKTTFSWGASPMPKPSGWSDVQPARGHHTRRLSNRVFYGHYHLGYRRSTPIGQCRSRTDGYHKGLTLGRPYYWSVQAIDTAWAGSQFASEEVSS